MILFYDIGLLELISATTNGKIIQKYLNKMHGKVQLWGNIAFTESFRGFIAITLHSLSDIQFLEFMDVINNIYNSCGKKEVDYIRKIMGMQWKLKENAFFKINRFVLIHGKHNIRISNPDCPSLCSLDSFIYISVNLLLISSH